MKKTIIIAFLYQEKLRISFQRGNILVVVVVVVMSDLTLSPFATCVDRCGLQGYLHCSFLFPNS